MVGTYAAYAWGGGEQTIPPPTTKTYVPQLVSEELHVHQIGMSAACRNK